MDSFGSRLRECRKQKGLSQNELAGILNTNHSVIGKYERDDVNPSIDAVKRLAEVLGTSVAYLIGEAGDMVIDKDTVKRLEGIADLNPKEKEHLFALMDAFLRDAKAKKAYS